MTATDTPIPTATRNRFFPGPTWTSHWFIDAEVMDDQFKHHLEMTFYGQADLGECLEIARTILPGDEESWIRSFSDMARRVEERAQASDARGKRVSAASAYLRASTYWRGGLMHYSHHDDPRQLEYGTASYRCYDRYLELTGYPAQPVEIPYEGSSLPGYFYRSPHAPAKAPLIIMFQGRDAWPEDTRWVYDGALQRGIHCLTFQGPGQGLALRRNHLHFRPDWEQVVTPVVDFAVECDGVDASRIALMGLSFGGYLAPRGAAFEHRLKMCIADPGVMNWGGSIMAQFPQPLRDAYAAGPEQFNRAMQATADAHPLHGWFLRDMLAKHGLSTPYELYEELLRCDLTPYVEQIQCETLILEGSNEIRSSGESQRLFDALRCSKHMIVFDESTTAQLHCQGGASGIAGETMFDWLDERL
ncbi:MAG TPA: alpha/beta fold hydrolase [Ilumatobacter sp.]|nr:alpha/beta fold hydrolase [Ilumatobacter sp.]